MVSLDSADTLVKMASQDLVAIPVRMDSLVSLATQARMGSPDSRDTQGKMA